MFVAIGEEAVDLYGNYEVKMSINKPKRKRKQSEAATVVSKWLIRALFMAPIAIVVISCLFFFWILWGHNILFRQTLHVYPGAQQVSNAYSAYNGGQGREILYFWTPDGLADVKDYYEAFAQPFIVDHWEGALISVFHPYGDELEAHEMLTENPLETDFSQQPRCHPSQIYSCVNIMIFPVEQSSEVRLPKLALNLHWDSQTPVPLALSISGGTFIVYGYYVNRW